MLLHSVYCILVLLLFATVYRFVNAADIPQYTMTKDRIVGGVNAFEASWPWQVSLHSSNYGGHFCGGSLINSEWILTAAHCLTGVTASSLRVSLERRTQQGVNTLQISRTVSKITVHSAYNSGTKDNDVALLKLTQPVGLSVFTNTNFACLPNPSDKFIVSAKCYSIGRVLGQANQTLPSQLQAVSSIVMSHTECNKYISSVTDQTQICSYSGSKNGCFGLSGSPLICLRPGGTCYLVGIESVIPESCSEKPFPTIYSNVAAYNSWIISATGL